MNILFLIAICFGQSSSEVPPVQRDDLAITLKTTTPSFHVREAVALEVTIQNLSENQVGLVFTHPEALAFHFSGGDRNSADRRKFMPPVMVSHEVGINIAPGTSRTYLMALNRYLFLEEARAFVVPWSYHARAGQAADPAGRQY